MPLRPYQESGIASIKQAWREGHRSIVAVAPGAAGKTQLAVSMTEMAFANDRIIQDSSKQFDVWFLAHRTELIDQPYRRYEKHGIRAGIVKAGVKSNPLARLQIASVQTLKNRPIIPTIRKRALCFIDEAHRCKSETYLDIIDNLKKTYAEVYFILLTATPYRGDHQGLGDVATKLIEITTPRQLYESGWIVLPKSFKYKTDFSGIPSADGEFLNKPLEDAINKSKLVADIVDTWLQHYGGSPGIGFAVNVAHSKYLTERFNARGIRAAHLDGMTPKDERKRLLARLAIGGSDSTHPEALDLISNVDVLTEGFDSESSYDLVLEFKDLWLGKSYPPEYSPLAVIGDWAPTESMGKYIQRAVRNCRIHPKKTRAVYLDHAGNIDRHCKLIQHEGFSLDEGALPLKNRLKLPRASKYVSLACAKCNLDLEAGCTKCPDCGSTEFATAKIDISKLEEAPGELSEDTETELAPRKQLPHEQEGWLRTRIRTWQADNEHRIAIGKPAMKFGVIWHQYLGLFKRQLDQDVVTKVCKEFGMR